MTSFADTTFRAILPSADESGVTFCEAIRDERQKGCIVYVAARTSRGLVRSENQDAMLAGVAPHGHAEQPGVMLAVFDGMGGRPGGGLASATAASTFSDARSQRLKQTLTADNVGKWLKQTLLKAHENIRERGKEGGMRDLGTTATVLLAHGGRVAIGHVGDTRAYRLRGGKLSLLTHDHTMVQALIDSGKTPEEAHASGWDGVLGSALGIDGMTATHFDIVETNVLQGDVFLLSSDGLHESVPHWQIAQIINERRSPYETAKTLVRKAYEKESTDNISVIVASVEASA